MSTKRHTVARSDDARFEVPNRFADLSDGSRGLTVAIRHFWENFPNKLTVSPDGTVAVLPMPRDFSEAIEHRSGERKTHWTLYYFHDGAASAAASQELTSGRNNSKVCANSSLSK